MTASASISTSSSRPCQRLYADQGVGGQTVRRQVTPQNGGDRGAINRLQIDHVYRELDDVEQIGAASCQNRTQIGKHLLGLCGQIPAPDDPSGRIQGNLSRG